MDIYLLRHGQSTANELRLVCGASDYPLSELGLAQGAQICEKLNVVRFDRVYCSPLLRARQTIANLRRDVEPVLVRELIELDTGALSHITVDELWARDPRYRYQGLNPDHRYPDGECLNDMLTRVQGWFDAERQKWKTGERILISGHEGTVCGILHGLMLLKINHYPSFLVGNCDHVQVSINTDEQMRIRFVPLGQRVA